MDTIIPNGEGVIELRGGEFGWEIEDYHDAETKASYMALYADRYSGQESESFTEIIKNVIKEQTGCKEVQFLFSDDYNSPYHSYIDHQSVDSDQYHYLFYNPEELRNFIFNKQSYLHTDNDNH